MHVKRWSLARIGVQQTAAVNFAGVEAHPLPTRELGPTWKPFFSPQSPEALSGQRTAPSLDLLHPPAAVKTPPPASFCIEKGSEETRRGKAGAPLSYPPPHCDQAFNPFLSRPGAGTHPGPSAHLPTPRDGSQQTSPALGGSRARPQGRCAPPPPPTSKQAPTRRMSAPLPAPCGSRTQVPPSLYSSQLRPKLLLEPTQADQPHPLAAVPRSRGC